MAAGEAPASHRAHILPKDGASSGRTANSVMRLAVVGVASAEAASEAVAAALETLAAVVVVVEAAAALETVVVVVALLAVVAVVALSGAVVWAEEEEEALVVVPSLRGVVPVIHLAHPDDEMGGGFLSKKVIYSLDASVTNFLNG